MDLINRGTVLLTLLAMILPVGVSAQDPVPVGKGSYAEFPPPAAGAGAAEMVGREFPVVRRDGRPIPTNKLWTWLLNGKASGSLWMYPWRVDPKEAGLELFFPIKWLESGSDPQCDAPLRVLGIDFQATGLLVKDWGDWTLAFRLPQSDDRYLDVTVGEGMPIVWVESHGVELAFQAGPDAAFARADGQAVRFPLQAGQLLVSSGGRLYGVFVPPAARWTRDGDRVRLGAATEDGSGRRPNLRGRSFAAFAALRTPADLATFAPCAYSIPRDSHVDWSYDARRGQVATTWTVKTEPLVPGKPDVVLQGWLAHHWRGANHALKLDGPTYLTPRGTMKTALGNRFELAYDFAGFLPYLPAPASMGLPHDFDRQRMATLLDRCAGQPKYGDDSYWGGKDLLRFAQYLLMARELNDPSRDELRAAAHRALADWLTYTPGETAHYFARYANWPALIGFKDSYDSARFNDQHFHYGYFTLSTALLAMDEPEFLADYGEMIRLVAKQYANWDRQDTRFPLFRTFDLWAGHSWAGGLGSPGGNNQESSSEAMQSWIGLYLLGTMLDDPDMTAAGAMGYAMESQATMEYWFNQHGDILPREYPHPIVGVLWSGGQVYGTYFSGDPGWIYGIQCLPQSPGLDYLARDSAFARRMFREMLDRRKAKEGSDDLGTMGDLGNVLLAQASLVDPEWAAAQFDRLWEANNAIVREHFGAGTTYYQAHSYRKLGDRQWDVRLSVPTGAVYFNQRTKATSYVAYNPKPYPVIVQAIKGDAVLGTFTAAARQLTCVTKLQSADKQVGLAGSVPADGTKNVSRRIDKVYVLFHSAVDAGSLAGIRMEGPGEPALTCTTADEGRVVVGTLAKPLRPNASYRVLVPATIRVQTGDSPLARDHTFAFTVEPQPPLAVESSVPTDGQERVNAARPELLLTFNAPMNASDLGRLRLDGPSAPTVRPELVGDGTQVKLQIAGPLEPDQTYAIVIPAGLTSIWGDTLRSEQAIRFSTAPAACPPNVYRESFAGGGYSADQTLEVDLRNTESPHSGQYAIKLRAPQQDGTVYFFAGTSDHGEGRKPVDLSAYKQVEFWLKGSTDRIWIKVGHPVFDKQAFTQTNQGGITQQYQRFALELPEPKQEINTLLAISVPAGQTVYVDDIRFVGPGAAERPPKAASGGAPRAAPAARSAPSPALRTWTDDTGQHRVVARLKSVTADGVELELENGKRVTVPLHRLSPQDRAYVRGQASRPKDGS
jgi:endoglucanase Acf2